MWEVSELTASLSRRVIAMTDTFEAAKEYVRNELGAIHLQDDDDHIGCADALLPDGRCVAIQPQGFKV